jgi:hypothetical protein
MRLHHGSITRTRAVAAIARAIGGVTASAQMRRLVARRLLFLPALVVGLSLAAPGPASALAGFQASVKGNNPKAKPCPEGDYVCGSATTNYGDGTWTFSPTGETPPAPGASCGSYEATVTFALDDASSSMLVLDETGSVCGPGNSIWAPGQSHSNGNPFYFTGSWMVETATGEFASIGVGTMGTDALHIAGAHSSGTYVMP